VTLTLGKMTFIYEFDVYPPSRCPSIPKMDFLVQSFQKLSYYRHADTETNDTKIRTSLRW